MQHLPQELVDYIIDYLHDDKSALASCACTHPTWVDTARHHLFKSVRTIVFVDPPEDSVLQNGRGVRQLCSDKNDPKRELKSVLHFFTQERNARYRRCVKHLLIRGLCTLEVNKIGEILAMFPSLRTLSLVAVRLLPLSASEFMKFGHFKVERLALSEVAAAPAGTMSKKPLLDLLSLFSHIGNLIVSEFYTGRVDMNEPFTLPNKVEISSISAIRLRDFDLLRALLVESAQMEAVTSFSSTITSINHIGYTNDFLAGFSPHMMRNLEFDFRWADRDVDPGV